jgi:FixJ family two-component response regulator
LARDRARRESEEAIIALKERFGSLSPGEREIMVEVARGRLSKQIAGETAAIAFSGSICA